MENKTDATKEITNVINLQVTVVNKFDSKTSEEKAIKSAENAELKVIKAIEKVADDVKVTNSKTFINFGDNKE